MIPWSTTINFAERKKEKPPPLYPFPSTKRRKVSPTLSTPPQLWYSPSPTRMGSRWKEKNGSKAISPAVAVRGVLGKKGKSPSPVEVRSVTKQNRKEGARKFPFSCLLGKGGREFSGPAFCSSSFERGERSPGRATPLINAVNRHKNCPWRGGGRKLFS